MVDRCVCHDVTFADLRRLAAATGHDLDRLATLTGCGTGCGCCVPYLRLMLSTGQTRFPVLAIHSPAPLATPGAETPVPGVSELHTNNTGDTRPPPRTLAG